MKTYWDHTEAERAALTTQDVEQLLAYELMEKGVLRPKPLALEPEADVPLPARRVFLLREGDGNYGTLLNVGFETIEQAEACRASIAFIRDQDGWQTPFFTRPVKGLQIVSEDMPTRDAVAAARMALSEQTRRTQANAAAKRTYDEETKKAADATSEIWANWHDCRRAEARKQEVRDTFAEYLRMTGGDEALARGFLAKAYSDAEITASVGETPVMPVETHPTNVKEG